MKGAVSVIVVPPASVDGKDKTGGKTKTGSAPYAPPPRGGTPAVFQYPRVDAAGPVQPDEQPGQGIIVKA
jgi:hypothetical protein